MWIGRSVAAASVLVLAACGGNEPRGQLSMVPRPELTAPPGEMSVRLLFMVNPVPSAGDSAVATASGAAPAKSGKWGTIGLADEGPGLTISADFRNATPGTYQLKILDEGSCSGLFAGEEDLDYVNEVDSQPVRLPAIAIDNNGELKREFAARGLSTADLRGRAVVLFDGTRPIACGSSAASRMPMQPQGGRKLPEGASSDGGRPGDGK